MLFDQSLDHFRFPLEFVDPTHDLKQLDEVFQRGIGHFDSCTEYDAGRRRRQGLFGSEVGRKDNQLIKRYLDLFTVTCVQIVVSLLQWNDPTIQ